MARRFEYDRITAEQFRSGLAAVEMNDGAFARIFGVRMETVEKWLDGSLDIPPWVRPVQAMLRVPTAMVLARQAAADMIRADNLRPEMGDYPYREAGGEG